MQIRWISLGTNDEKETAPCKWVLTVIELFNIVMDNFLIKRNPLVKARYSLYAGRSVSLNFRGFAFTLNMNATFGLFRLSIIITILRKLNYHLGHFSLHNFLVQNFLELRLWKQLLGHILCLVKSVHYPCLHVHYPVRLLFPTDRNVIFESLDMMPSEQSKLN